MSLLIIKHFSNNYQPAGVHSLNHENRKLFLKQNEAYFAHANIVDRLPFMTLPLLRLRSRTKTDQCVIGKNTKIVIEGYPRSANNFAVEAFRSSQNRPVRIAHHTHTIAQVIQATKWKLPTLVLIREPEQAVLSRIIRNKHCSVNSALINYIMYYEVVKKLNSSITIASFEEVTNDLGEVISRINNASSTNFLLFNHESKNVDFVF